MLVLIDNYDSFTYNLVQYFGKLGVAPVVYRNDKISVDELEKLHRSGWSFLPGRARRRRPGFPVRRSAPLPGASPSSASAWGIRASGTFSAGRSCMRRG